MRGLIHAAVWTLGLSLSACAAALEGRYIVYFDADTAQRMDEADTRAQALEDLESALSGDITLERQLATGGWVMIVNSPATSPDRQQQAIESLPGVESVEPDARMQRM